MAERGQLKQLDLVLGSNYLLIRYAMSLISRYNLELAQYTTLLVGKENATVVVFFSPNSETAERRPIGVSLGSDAELSGSDLSALLSGLDQMNVMAKIQGGNLLAIEAAVALFLRKMPHIDLNRYKINVMGRGELIVIVFEDKDRTPSMRGRGKPGVPGFEVTLMRADLSIVKAHFSR